MPTPSPSPSASPLYTRGDYGGDNKTDLTVWRPTAFAPNTIAPANLITPDFPLNRRVDAFTPASGHTGFAEPPVGQVPIPATPSLDNLRGASLPLAQIGQAIGGDGLVVVAVGSVDPEPTFGASTEAFLTH